MCAKEYYITHLKLRLRGELPMTLIAAMNCGDHLLITSDSSILVNSNYRYIDEKLDSLDDTPLVWGSCGDLATAKAFNNWLHKENIGEIRNWEDFADIVSNKIAELNGKRITLTKLAGKEPDERDDVSIIIAGYLNGIPEILEVDEEGKVIFELESKFSAIGSGSNHAKIIELTLRKTIPAVYDYRECWLKRIMILATHADPNCITPIYGRKITAEGIVELWQKENQKNQNH